MVVMMDGGWELAGEVGYGERNGSEVDDEKARMKMCSDDDGPNSDGGAGKVKKRARPGQGFEGREGGMKRSGWWMGGDGE